MAKKAETGVVVFQEWRFSRAIIEAAYSAEKLVQKNGRVIVTRSWIVVLTAQLHSLFGTPKMEASLAVAKLAGGKLMPEISVEESG